MRPWVCMSACVQRPQRAWLLRGRPAPRRLRLQRVTRPAGRASGCGAAYVRRLVLLRRIDPTVAGQILARCV